MQNVNIFVHINQHENVVCKLLIAVICPRISDPFNIVTYYIKWVTTSWTESTVRFSALL